MRTPRVLTGAVALALGAVSLAACSGSGSGSGPNSITLYSGQHVQTTHSLVAAFEQKTGITVNVRSDDEDVLAQQIVTEGAAFTGRRLLHRELTAHCSFWLPRICCPRSTLSTLANGQSKYDSPDGKWVGVSARVSVMVYNTSLLRPNQLPTSAMQLADPAWKGKIGLAGGETDFQPIVTSIARAHGTAGAETWLRELKTNATSHLYPDNEILADEVNRGQVALGIINQYYWYRQQAELGASNMHSAIAHFAPKDVGYVVDVSGAGVLKSSSNQADAQKFVAFLTSAQGQQIIADSNSFEYPINSGVTTSKPETPFNQLQPNPISIAELGTGAEAIALLQEAQLL